MRSHSASPLRIAAISKRVLSAPIRGASPLHVDLQRVVGEERRRAIASAMEEVGSALLRPVMDRLGEGYSYGELKLNRAMLNRSQPAGGDDTGMEMPPDL